MMRSAPNWKIGSATRDDADKMKARVSNYPPPGAYNANYNSSKSKDAEWKFGTGPRSKLAGNSFTPGPQAYKLASKAVEGSKFSLGLKLESTSTIGAAVAQTRGNPGPGGYSGDY
jgi:hypothetical protein